MAVREDALQLRLAGPIHRLIYSLLDNNYVILFYKTTSFERFMEGSILATVCPLMQAPSSLIDGAEVKGQNHTEAK